MINGPTVTALLSAQGNIHIFSDKNAHMLEMFSDRPMFYTECKRIGLFNGNFCLKDSRDILDISYTYWV
jgi:hypothetical protein